MQPSDSIFYMMTPERLRVLDYAINHYGAEAQKDVAIEEMSELTQAILKKRRIMDTADRTVSDICTANDNIAEETADVIIMLTQLIMICGNEKQIGKAIDYKIKRLADRLGIEIREETENREYRMPNDIGLSFTTINANGEYVHWDFARVEDLRKEWISDDPDVPANDDPVADCELRAVPIYVNNFLDIIELLGIEQESEETT